MGSDQATQHRRPPLAVPLGLVGGAVVGEGPRVDIPSSTSLSPLAAATAPRPLVTSATAAARCTAQPHHVVHRPAGVIGDRLCDGAGSAGTGSRRPLGGTTAGTSRCADAPTPRGGSRPPGALTARAGRTCGRTEGAARQAASTARPARAERRPTAVPEARSTAPPCLHRLRTRTTLPGTRAAARSSHSRCRGGRAPAARGTCAADAVPGRRWLRRPAGDVPPTALHSPRALPRRAPARRAASCHAGPPGRSRFAPPVTGRHARQGQRLHHPRRAAQRGEPACRPSPRPGPAPARPRGRPTPPCRRRPWAARPRTARTLRPAACPGR